MYDTGALTGLIDPDHLTARYDNGRGYIRVIYRGVKVLEHRLVWELSYGPVPEGHDIHHINHVRSDNRLENLVCLTREEHHRIHSGWEDRGGEWVRACSGCGEEYSSTSDMWCRGRGVINSSLCVPCLRAPARERMRRLRAQRRSADAAATTSAGSPVVCV